MRKPIMTPTAPFRRTACAAVAVALAVGISGCKTHQTEVRGWMLADPEARHPIEVLEREAGVDLVVTRGSSGLTRRQMRKAHDFVVRYKREGGDRLIVRAPKGTPNEVASKRALDDLRRVLESARVSRGEVDFQPYKAGGDPHAPVQLGFVQVVAKGPKCGQWPDNLARDPYNAPYHNFGCATQNNLAAMVSDPRDLVEPRAMTPRSSERRDVVWDKWIRGEVTGAERSQDERVQASDVQGGGN